MAARIVTFRPRILPLNIAFTYENPRVLRFRKKRAKPARRPWQRDVIMLNWANYQKAIDTDGHVRLRNQPLPVTYDANDPKVWSFSGEGWTRDVPVTPNGFVCVCGNIVQEIGVKVYEGIPCRCFAARSKGGAL